MPLLLESLKKINEWKFLEALGINSPSNTFRWILFSVLCVLVFSEWVAVGLILEFREQKSEMAMVTLTNCSFVPLALYCLYHVIVSGKRVDLLVDAIFALGTANASLWYHFCANKNPGMSYCEMSDGTRDPTVFDKVMWWDFAASYMMFVQAALVLADLREMVLKIPMYGVSMYLCYLGMEEKDTRTKALGSNHIQFALFFACTSLFLRVVYVYSCFFRLQSHSFWRAAKSLFFCINPFAFVLAKTFFIGGMLCAFVWTDQSANSDNSEYTTPHGFWHLGMGFASGCVTWMAVEFSENWKSKMEELKTRRHPKSPAMKPPVEEECEMVEIEPFDVNV